MCEGNQERLTDRIWVDHFTHTFLHIPICVCEKVHVCTDTYVGGGCVSSCVQVQIEARLWFLGCYPLILGWGLTGLQLIK